MSIYVVIPIAVLIIALICYVFISQHLEKQRAQKMRMIMGLKTKYRNMSHMVSGFPPHFLSNELMSLAYRSLLDTCESLHNIEPNNIEYTDEITRINNQLSALSKSAPPQRVLLKDQQQMKEVRQHLQDLQDFVQAQPISKPQAKTYLDQIHKITFQMTIDEFIHQAKVAQQGDQLRLAIHYFGLARKQLIDENSTHTYDKQIAQLDAVIEKIEVEASKRPETPAEPVGAVSKEWEDFNKKPDTSWQKKHAYD